MIRKRINTKRERKEEKARSGRGLRGFLCLRQLGKGRIAACSHSLPPGCCPRYIRHRFACPASLRSAFLSTSSALLSARSSSGSTVVEWLAPIHLGSACGSRRGLALSIPSRTPVMSSVSVAADMALPPVCLLICAVKALLPASSAALCLAWRPCLVPSVPPRRYHPRPTRPLVGHVPSHLQAE